MKKTLLLLSLAAACSVGTAIAAETITFTMVDVALVKVIVLGDCGAHRTCGCEGK